MNIVLTVAVVAIVAYSAGVLTSSLLILKLKNVEATLLNKLIGIESTINSKFKSK